jgi:hypothetical protein
MGKTKAPKGKTDKGQSTNKKVFELALASPANFFVRILPFLCFSKVGVFSQWSNNLWIKI